MKRKNLKFWSILGFSVGMLVPFANQAQSRPQEPKPPLPYRVEEVTFQNVAGGFELSGTLAVPELTGRCRAAILIPGSGKQDRDEELFGHNPFVALADSLARHGIAVLRYDGRGTGKSQGEFKTATTPYFATDVEAALDFIKKRTEIDTTGIGLIGHGEGGLVASIVASQRRDVAFIVLMAGPGLTGEQNLLLRSALISKTEDMDDKRIEANDRLDANMFSVLKKNHDNTKAGQKLRTLIADFNKKNAKDPSFHPMSETEISARVESLTSPWFRCFLTLNPEDFLKKVTCPLLAINGSIDLQVPAAENLEAIEKAMIFGGNSTYTVEELPGLNHLFQTAATGSPLEHEKIEEAIAPAAVDVIVKWLGKKVDK